MLLYVILLTAGSMALPCSLDFQVNRFEPQLVTPEKQTPHETKTLSDIDDQEGLRFQTPLIFSYMNNPLMEERDPIQVVREALRRALVYYYPLAGRLREGPNRKLMVDCNGEGVLFVEADADVTLEQLGDRLEPPSPFLEDFLYNVPGSDDILGTPLLLVQVTRLTCGGFVFALRINHTICDGLGLAQFLNAVGELARGDEHSAPSIPPVWERNLLNARDPPSITCTHHEYEQVVDLSDHGSDAAASPTVQRSFYFGPKEIRAMKKQVLPHLSACASTFELITACLWKCRTIALEMNPKQMVCVSCVASARGKHNNLALSLGYYGNAFAFPSAVSTVQLLCENPLGYAVELVKKATSRMSEEYIRSVADLMVIKGRPKFSITGNFIVADTTRSGYGQVDFGWGKPIFAGVAKSVNFINMYVQLKNKEKDGTLALLCLPLSCVERFQHEFNKMTLEPVEHNYIIKHARIIKSTM